MSALSTLPEAVPDALTIADVARETGIQKDTLRVWERRYGFPEPVRDPIGERRYSVDQLNRLRQIKRLLDAGLRPGAVVALPAEALRQRINTLSVDPAGKRPAQAKARVDVSPADAAAVVTALEMSQWMDWIRDGAVDALHQALGQHALKHGLMRTIDSLVGPLGYAVGEAWAAGQITIYQEHLFTAAVQRFLQDALGAADQQHPPPRKAPRVLLTTLPGEQHTMGLLMAECMLALEGCERRSLGRDTPLSDVAQAAEHWQMDVVALSVSALPVASSVWGGLRQLRAALPPRVAIWVGGSSAHLARRQVPEGIWVLQSVDAMGRQIQLWRAQAGL